MDLLNQVAQSEGLTTENISVDVKELQDIVSQLEAENMILEEACNNKDTTIAQAKEAYDALKRTNVDYNHKICALTEENKALSNNSLAKEVNTLKETLTKMTSKLDVAINKAKELNAERISLKEQLNEVKLAYKCEADMVKELMEQKEELLAKLNKEQALDSDTVAEEDYKEVIVDILEDTAKELSEEEVKEEANVEVDKEVEEDMSKVAQFICNINATKIQPILNAEYRDVVDTLVSSIDDVADKYISMLNKGKVKNQGENIKAAGKLKSLLTIKRNDIEKEANAEEKESLLVKLGALVKSIFVKALKVLLATGKIVGKASIIVSTLITKVVVYTLTETIKAGKTIIGISIDEYKKALM